MKADEDLRDEKKTLSRTALNIRFIFSWITIHCTCTLYWQGRVIYEVCQRSTLSQLECLESQGLEASALVESRAVES